MSVVYEGRLMGVAGFEKKVAVKSLLSSKGLSQRFKDLVVEEAKLVANLVHENIVQIYQLDQLRDQSMYIIMEHVHGLSLADLMAMHVESGKRLPEALAVHIASRIARGLAYAHAFTDDKGNPLGIVHRDVCPSNILITTEGLSKLIDFGVAKAMGNTVIGEKWLTGKVPYMAPEQAACGSVDFRADIYSLGAVLFEVLAQCPIRPPSSIPIEDDFRAIPVPWERLPPDTGAELIAILRQMLAPESVDRQQDTSKLAQELEYYIYKDGYGPTIQTVEAYLRVHAPSLYQCQPSPAGTAAADQVTLLDAEGTIGCVDN